MTTSESVFLYFMARFSEPESFAGFAVKTEAIFNTALPMGARIFMFACGMVAWLYPSTGIHGRPHPNGDARD